PSVEKGNAVTNVWTGDVTISWTTGSSHSELIDKSKFTELKAGDKVRATFASMKLGAQGKILHGWTSWDPSIVPIKKLPSECGDYFEYTVTEDMVTDIQTDGLRVSGIGYNLISVDIIDPDKEYTVVADFDKNDIKAWEPEETPNLTFTLQSIEANEITVPIVVTLSTDTYEDFKTYTENVTLASGEKKTVDVNLTDLEPGFYRMTAKANNNTVCTYYIGYNPTAIGCENDAQPDFWTFWDGWKRKLAKIDINATLTELTDKSTTSRKVYEVKMQSVPDAEGESNVYIYGYYAEPTGEDTYPCLVRFQGTASGSGIPTAMGGDDNPGWCELVISTRGQMLSRVKDNEEFKKFIPEGKSAADFYAYGLGDNDKHYYRAAYLDCKRAIDFVASRTAVNKDQIFAAGGSQGGCFTYVAAALDDRIRAIAPSITGHADFPHTMEIVSWPTSIFNNWITEHTGDGNYATPEEAKAALLKHLSYFDTKNFASRITCPVITNFSLQDQTDGPHLNISPYNLLVNVAAANKSYSINPFLGHSTPSTWEATFKEFFNKYKGTPATKSYFLSVGETGYSTVYLPFDALVPDGVKIYTVSSIETDKVLLKGHTAESGNQLLLPKETAVVVNAAEGDYQFVSNSTGITSTNVNGTNHLKGVTERTAVSSLNSNCTIYALGIGNDDIAGFYKVNSDSYIPANKAYLSVATSSPMSLSRAFYISSSTGVTSVGNDEQNIDTPVYSIKGIKSVNGNKSGILVKKGKKFINK
ncbi:MAG: acetylxylan esterase, partial [Prevotella sp.]